MSDDKEQELRSRLLVLFKNQTCMVDAYIQQFGTEMNMKNIQTIRSQFPGLGDTISMPAVKDDEPAAEDKKDGSNIVFKFPDKAFEAPVLDPTLESPVYPRVVDCPVCKKWGLNSMDMKAKALAIMNDPFFAPVYKSTGRFQEVNFLVATITVCDSCLLASPDRKDFQTYNKLTRQNQDSQMAPQVIRELKETTDIRKARFEKSNIGDALFKLPRCHAAAITSYQFADMRAAIEADKKVQGAYYKRGNYWTRIALLCRQCGMVDREALEIAAEHFKTAFMLSDFPNQNLEFQTIYILFNLFLYLEKQKEARDYMSVLDKTRQDLEKMEKPPEGVIPSVKKWIEMCRARWDDRDNPNFWKTPGL